MGTVFKRVASKPLPVGAEIVVRKGERIADGRIGEDDRGRRR
jgi:hypothetical protein